jgi:hypothetical protein
MIFNKIKRTNIKEGEAKWKDKVTNLLIQKIVSKILARAVKKKCPMIYLKTCHYKLVWIQET